MSHWASELIGKPWAFGATGPEVFDCLGFTIFVQRTQYGIEMLEPGYTENLLQNTHLLAQGEERARWAEVEVPEDGDVILMARRKFPTHIGTWIRANGKMGALHCLEGIGVVFQDQGQLRLSGWGSFHFYRHKSKCVT